MESRLEFEITVVAQVGGRQTSKKRGKEFYFSSQIISPSGTFARNKLIVCQEALQQRPIAVHLRPRSLTGVIFTQYGIQRSRQASHLQVCQPTHSRPPMAFIMDPTLMPVQTIPILKLMSEVEKKKNVVDMTILNKGYYNQAS